MQETLDKIQMHGDYPCQQVDLKSKFVSDRNISSKNLLQKTKLSSSHEMASTQNLPQRSYERNPNSGINRHHHCEHSQCFGQSDLAHFHDDVRCEKSVQTISNRLSQHYDRAFNEGDLRKDNDGEQLWELLHKVNEALETYNKINRSHRGEKRSVEQELIFQIHEILKREEDRTLYAPRDVELQRTENRFSSRGRMHFQSSDRFSRRDEATIDDGFHQDAYSNKCMPPRGNHDINVHKRCFGNDADVLRRGDSNMIAEDRFTGASLEYWGRHSIDSVEHTLSHSEWFGSPKWQQNQQDWFNNDIQNPNRILYENYAYM
ncbi:4895_t:CDS:2 [Acaulospora morrowiae]|uniref:4895_t:CDS:1 n=1 Tax=Acaulospora morrowiae TaxID=94023 RepID=A0A9N9HQP3_9GLOM|nr:4895_t:CDS:2 [Acaulospora morrowiae]